MLEQLRSKASGLIAQILIGLLVLSFAVWGINDVFRGSIDTTVAEVGDTEIPADRFMLEYRQELQQRSQQLDRRLTLQEGQALGFDRQVLEQMVGRTALDMAAADLGLAAGDDQVAQDIFNDPAFYGPTGKFDRTTFEQVLFANGVNEDFVIADRRLFIAREQLINTVTAGAGVPDGYADHYFATANETRKARYVVLTPEMVPVPDDPDEETLQRFYDGRAAGLFQVPEYRRFSYAVMTPETVAKTIEIPEETLKAEFEARRAEFDVPEKRTVEQITFGTQEEAQAAYDKLSEGTTFAAIAADRELADEDYKLGTITRRQFFSDEIGDAAFSTEAGAVSEPVEGPLGWTLLHVTEIVPAEEADFEEVRGDIEQELALDRAYDELFEIANQVEDARAGGASLAEAAQMVGLSTVEVPKVTSRGLGPDGQRPATLPQQDEIIATAFDGVVDEEIPMEELSDGTYYWVDVEEVTPARVKPLEEVRDEVVETWRKEEREARLLRMAADLAERVNKGESFDAVAQEMGRSPLTTGTLERQMSNETFSRVAINNLFSVSEGQATYGPVGFGSSVVLMQASEVNPGDTAEAGDAFDTIKTRLDQAFVNDLMVQYVQALRDRYGVEVHPQAVAYAIGGGDGA